MGAGPSERPEPVQVRVRDTGQGRALLGQEEAQGLPLTSGPLRVRQGPLVSCPLEGEEECTPRCLSAPSALGGPQACTFTRECLHAVAAAGRCSSQGRMRRGGPAWAAKASETTCPPPRPFTALRKHRVPCGPGSAGRWPSNSQLHLEAPGIDSPRRGAEALLGVPRTDPGGRRGWQPSVTGGCWSGEPRSLLQAKHLSAPKRPGRARLETCRAARRWASPRFWSRSQHPAPCPFPSPPAPEPLLARICGCSDRAWR